MEASDPRYEELGSTGWVIAWAGTCVFSIGVALFVALIVLGPPDPYAGAALLAGAICLMGVVVFGTGAVAWLGRLLLTRTPAPRRAAALAALGGAAASFAALIADVAGAIDLPPQTWPVALVGVSLLALGAILAADVAERNPARLFAATWILLVAVTTYRIWTDVRVEVVWLGSTTSSPAGSQVAFSASRSGDFEIRFGARSCLEGRAIASGHYTWEADIPGSSLGAAAWVDLPDAVLPLRRGDLVRVCLRDGLAAGTAAGEVIDPPSFWPRD